MGGSIDQQIDQTIGKEGAYVNNLKDPGGPTIWGITQVEARAFGYQGVMQDMPRATAVAIYKSRYYAEPRVDLIDAIDSDIAFEVFDTGVNMGPYWGAFFLQVALNVFNREAKDYPDIGMDGRIGSLTAHALSAFLAKRGALGKTRLLRAQNCQQGQRYINLGLAKASNEEFEFGWFDRVEIA